MNAYLYNYRFENIHLYLLDFIIYNCLRVIDYCKTCTLGYKDQCVRCLKSKKKTDIVSNALVYFQI